MEDTRRNRAAGDSREDVLMVGARGTCLSLSERASVASSVSGGLGGAGKTNVGGGRCCWRFKGINRDIAGEAAGAGAGRARGD
jgi:hypothetical protein